MSKLKMVEVPKVEIDLLRDWAGRIHLATICMNHDNIKQVVGEIASHYHVSEGDCYEDKLLRLQEKGE